MCECVKCRSIWSQCECAFATSFLNLSDLEIARTLAHELSTRARTTEEYC